MLSKMKRRLYSLFGMSLLAALWLPQCHAANIITFADAAHACGGAVLCSTTGVLPLGTQGYVETGSSAFDLSTITQWFQIDPSGVSHLASQPAEQLGGAGGFLVVNDTGVAVTSFSLTLTDTFTSTTPSVGPCPAGPQSGKECDNFQAHGGDTYAFNTELSGSDFSNCTQGTTSGATCTGAAGGVAANFAPNSVTYTWTTTPGVSIAAGAKFDITFASWDNDVFASSCSVNGGVGCGGGGASAGTGTTGSTATAGGSGGEVPEPASIVLLGSILAVISTTLRKRKAIRS